MSVYWLKPEVVIAVVSAFIALCALGATIWSGVIARIHNRLTVKPISSFSVEISKHSDKIGLCIRNKGFGPLILVKGAITKGDQSYDLSDHGLLSLFPMLRSNHFHFQIAAPNCVILPNESLWVVSTELHHDHDELVKTVEISLRGVKIDIEFESIYGDRFKDKCSLAAA